MASGSTPNYAIPYPLQTDPVDVAGDVEQLATRIDSNINEWIQDVVGLSFTSGTYLNGINPPIYNDTTGTISLSLSQDLQSTASPTFANLNLTGSILTPSIIDVTSTTNALRITQKGSGNALLIEDTTNPDSTPFVINSDGQIVSGTTTSFPGYSTNLQLIGTDSLLTGGANLRRISDSSNGQTLFIEKARGASLSTPQILENNDEIGSIIFRGFDGTNWVTASEITSIVNGSPGTADMPGALVFLTTPDGTTSSLERMRITRDGYVGINNISPTSELHVTGTITGTAGLYGNVQSNSATITNITSTSISSVNISTSPPVSSNHVATKGYVDGLTGSLSPEIINFDDISTLFDGMTRRFYLTNSLNSTRLFARRNLISDSSFEGVPTIKFRDYRIGDIGPAGGIIFITPTTAGNTTGRFFEAAPANIDGTTDLVSNSFRTSYIPAADSTIIGAGLQNTLDIIASQTIREFDQNLFLSTTRTNLMENGGQLGRWNRYVIGDIVNADFTVSSSTVPRSNLVSNPNIATNTTGWTAQGTGAAIARNGSNWYIGGGSIQVTKAAFIDQGASTIVNVVPLRNYFFSTFVQIPTGQEAGGIYLTITWRNASGVTISSASSSTTAIDQTMGWTRLSMSGQAPLDAFDAVIFIRQGSSGTNGQTFLISSILFEESNILLPYFSGTWLDRPPAFSLFRTNSQTFNTANSMLFTPRNTTDSSAFRVVGGYIPGDTQSISIAGDQVYTISAYTYQELTSSILYSVRISLEFFDSSFNLISQTSGPSNSFASLMWNRSSFTFTSPSNAAYVRYTFLVGPSAVNWRIYLDGLMLEQSPILQPFFDGDYSENRNSVATARESWTYQRSSWNPNSSSSLITYTYTGTVVVNATDNTAANLARNYSLNGFSDWHLPSREELSQLYSALSVLRSRFPGINYWSTSTFDDELPYIYAINYASYPQEETRGQFFVRPVRSFAPQPINGSTVHSVQRIGEKWTPTDSGVTITRTSERKYIRNSSMKVQLNGNPSGSPLYKQGVIYNASQLLLNTTYTFSAWVYVENGSNVSISAFDSSGLLTKSSIIAESSNPAWTRIDCTFTTANDPNIIVYIGNNELTDVVNTFFLDAVLLEQTNQLLEYFDGVLAPSSAGRIVRPQSFILERDNSPSIIEYYEAGEFKPTNPNRLQLSIYGILQTVSYPEYTWQSMFPTDGFTVDSDGYVNFSEAPAVGAKFDAKYIAGNNTTADTNKKLYPFRAIDILLGS